MRNNLLYGQPVLSIWAPLDESPMHVWAEKVVKLPKRGFAQPGPFSTATSHWMNDIMGAIQDESVRKVVLVKSVQCGGTLAAAEIPIVYWAITAPGDTLWVHQSEEAARTHAKSRFNPLLKRIPQIRAMLPKSRTEDTQLQLYLPDCFLILCGASENTLQSKSCRYVVCSEAWLFPSGLLAQAEARVSKYQELGVSKTVVESQASTDGDDFHAAWLSGSQETWHVKCAGCGAYSALEFFGRSKADPTKLACVIWADTRDAAGVWDVAKAAASARWVCPDCGHAHADNAITRALWNESGKWVALRPDAPPSIRSFRLNSLVSRSLYDLVVQFLEADAAAKLGLFEALKIFRQQRLSEFWKSEDQFTAEPVVMKTAGYLLTDPTITAPIVDEAKRFLLVDVQGGGVFWVLVRAFRRDGSSRLLYFSKVHTIEQIAEIRERFMVEPQLTFMDCAYQLETVLGYAAAGGYTCLRGVVDESFPWEKNGVKFRKAWSKAQWVAKDGRNVPVINWASNQVKFILHTLRSGRGAGFEIADDTPPEWISQMTAERLKDFVDSRTKRLVARWTKTRRDNHAFDLESMAILAAMMTDVLAGPKLADPAETPTPPTP